MGAYISIQTPKEKVLLRFTVPTIAQSIQIVLGASRITLNDAQRYPVLYQEIFEDYMMLGSTQCWGHAKHES